ncbi:uncharacterized protein LOC143452410 isoform X2 [Clavelina lepadiformis]|uniref:uncharacterized protein LOC143452410 isoform X2 n=1 Tax=Clavelina lepadiformis TaxID=159417 RepID=UPI0040419E78
MSGNNEMKMSIITKIEEEIIDDVVESTTADFHKGELAFVGNEDREDVFEEASTSAVKAVETSFINNQDEEIFHEEHSLLLDDEAEPNVHLNLPGETVKDASDNTDSVSESSDSKYEEEAPIIAKKNRTSKMTRILLLVMLIAFCVWSAILIHHLVTKAS